MSRNLKYSAEEKINAVKEYLGEKESMSSIAKRLDNTNQSFKQWVINYEVMGIDAFTTYQNKHYSKTEKEQGFSSDGKTPAIYWKQLRNCVCRVVY